MLKNILIFWSLLISLIIWLDFLTWIIIDKFANFSIVWDPKYVIVGNSHPECAYNDSIIQNFKNLGKSGEPYFYTYFKLKKILEQNPSIGTVFVEYTNGQISIQGDQGIWADMSLSAWFPIMSPFLGLKEHFLIAQNNPSGYFNILSYSNKSKIVRILHWDFDYFDNIGWYLKLSRHQREGLMDNVEYMKHATGSIQGENIKVSKWNLTYLDQIVQLWNIYNKKIVFIRSPQNLGYHWYDNEQILMKTLHDRYSNVAYIDFSDFPLNIDEYGDLEHLNSSGATVYSIWFNKMLQKWLLTNNNKQKFIDTNMIFFKNSRNPKKQKVYKQVGSDERQ